MSMNGIASLSSQMETRLFKSSMFLIICYDTLMELLSFNCFYSVNLS